MTDGTAGLLGEADHWPINASSPSAPWSPSDLTVARSRLESFGVPVDVVEVLCASLSSSATGVLLYGSRARGDVRPASDVDLLVVDDVETGRKVKHEGLSMSVYSRDELGSSSGTLFGYHLARDGQIILDRKDAIAKLLSSFPVPDPVAILTRIRRLSAILTVDGETRHRNLPGLCQVARYLLRSALYAVAIQDNRPCFSVSEIAVRNGDPRLVTILSSHPSEHGTPMLESLSDLAARLAGLVGEPEAVFAGKTLDAVAVENVDTDPDMSSIAVLALHVDDGGVRYEDLPRILL